MPNRIEQTTPAYGTPLPGAGGWTPSKFQQFGVSVLAGVLTGAGGFLSVIGEGDMSAFTWRGFLAAVFMGAGGAIAGWFGVGSAGPRNPAR